MGQTLTISQLVLDHTSEAAFLLDQHACLLDINAAACQSLGYTRAQLLQMTLFDIDPSYTSSQWHEHWQELKTHTTFTFESLQQTNNGHQFPVEVNASFFSHNGEEYMFALVRDISRRKQAEEALRESEERFRALVETTDEWIWAMDLRCRLTYSNPGVEAILGYKPEEVTGKRNLSLLHPDDQKKLLVALPEYIKTKTGWKGRVMRWRHRDGSFRHLESNASPILDSSGKISGFRGADRDITAQRQALKALLSAQERKRQYLEVAGVIMLSLDTAGRVDMINRKGCEILGYPKEEILQRDWFSNFLLPEDAERIRAKFNRLLEGDDHSLAAYENPVRTRNGEARLIAWRNVLLTDRNGHAIGGLSSGVDITDRKMTELAIEQTKKEWNYAMDFFDDPIYLLDLKLHLVRANQAFYRMTELSEAEAIGRHIAEILHPEGEETLCPVCRIQEELRDSVITMEADNPDNPACFPIEVVSRVIRQQDNQPSGILMTMRDLSRVRQTQEKLSQSKAVFESTIEGIMITDTRLNIVAVNPAFTTITGYSATEAMGKNPALLKSGRHHKDFYHELWTELNESGKWQGEIWNRRKNGEVYPEWLTISTITDDNSRVLQYIGVFSDISQIKQSQSRLEFLAHHDPLTSLPNRMLFISRLEHAIHRARRNDTMAAVLFLDLDRFKHINDSLGHAVGDSLLEAVAQRFTEVIRDDDTVARLGGDEFVILVEELNDSEHAAVFAEKVIKSIASPFTIQGHELFVSTSIGISLYPQDGNDVKQLLCNADAAMYRAKNLGRGNYQFYTQKLSTHAFEHQLLERQLRKAIEQDQLVIYYQPQVDMKNGRINGIEALVRWQHPDLGIITPAQFIPLAETTNLIVPLSEWVLRHACTQARNWLDLGINFGHISVNISNSQIQQGDLLNVVHTILADSGLPPERLELDITETLIMGQSQPTNQLLRSLHELNISLAIDDFGTGCSSLAYLKQIPINKLKIDRSFVTGLPGNKNDAAIARAVIALGHSMSFTVIAEGVETEAQRDFLIKEECEQAQGFLYSKAVNAEQVTSLLQKHH